MSDLLLFSFTLMAIYLTPGPDMLLILSTSMNRGTKQAVAVSLGLALARGVHVILAAIGLAALLQSTPWAYHLIKIAGATYLLYLAWRILTQESNITPTPAATNNQHKQFFHSFSQGVFTNLLNPKSLIFCSVLLPQFVKPTMDIALQFTTLGVILVVMGLSFDLLYALLGKKALAFTASRQNAQKIQNRIVAGLLTLIALKVGCD